MARSTFLGNRSLFFADSLLRESTVLAEYSTEKNFSDTEIW